VPRTAGVQASASPLVDRGGPVLTTVQPYAIWWGPASGLPSDAVAGMANFFAGLGGSAYAGVATQYLRGARLSIAPVVNLVDPSAPSSSGSEASIAAEVAKVTGRRIDPAGLYFVFTSNRSRGGNYCAWHSSARIAGRVVPYAYMPNLDRATDCDPGDRFGANAYSEGTRAWANVTAHELMEAVTDPQPSAATAGWLDGNGEEIGDKCAWKFSAPVRLANGSRWQLQQEWSNAARGCVQG